MHLFDDDGYAISKATSPAGSSTTRKKSPQNAYQKWCNNNTAAHRSVGWLVGLGPIEPVAGEG